MRNVKHHFTLALFCLHLKFSLEAFLSYLFIYYSRADCQRKVLCIFSNGKILGKSFMYCSSLHSVILDELFGDNLGIC